MISWQSSVNPRLLLTPVPSRMTRQSAIHDGTGGGVCDPPRGWLLIELELRLKNKRVGVLLVTWRSRSYQKSRSWVNRWALRSDQWSENGQNTISLITQITRFLSSEQARAAIQRPKRSLWSVEYNAMHFGPLFSVLGLQFNFVFIKIKWKDYMLIMIILNCAEIFTNKCAIFSLDRIFQYISSSQ